MIKNIVIIDRGNMKEQYKGGNCWQIVSQVRRIGILMGKIKTENYWPLLKLDIGNWAVCIEFENK